MDIADLPTALYRLAHHLEQTDDDPFTLRSRDAVLLAMKLLAEIGDAVDHALRLRYSPNGPPGELDLPAPDLLRRAREAARRVDPENCPLCSPGTCSPRTCVDGFLRHTGAGRSAGLRAMRRRWDAAAPVKR